MCAANNEKKSEQLVDKVAEKENKIVRTNVSESQVGWTVVC
jgi:hypothetical protein